MKINVQCLLRLNYIILSLKFYVSLQQFLSETQRQNQWAGVLTKKILPVKKAGYRSERGRQSVEAKETKGPGRQPKSKNYLGSKSLKSEIPHKIGLYLEDTEEIWHCECDVCPRDSHFIGL